MQRYDHRHHFSHLRRRVPLCRNLLYQYIHTSCSQEKDGSVQTQACEIDMHIMWSCVIITLHHFTRRSREQFLQYYMQLVYWKSQSQRSRSSPPNHTRQYHRKLSASRQCTVALQGINNKTELRMIDQSTMRLEYSTISKDTGLPDFQGRVGRGQHADTDHR